MQTALMPDVGPREAVEELERLSAIQAIQQLKARYFRLMDMRDWDAYEALFADDFVADVSLSSVVLEPGSEEDRFTHPDRLKDAVFRDAKSYRQFVEALLRGVRSVHHGHMAEIDIISPTRARGVFAMEDLLDFPPGFALEGKPLRSIHGHGHYWETYERIGGNWKIKTMTITRLREVRV